MVGGRFRGRHVLRGRRVRCRRPGRGARARARQRLAPLARAPQLGRDGHALRVDRPAPALLIRAARRGRLCGRPGRAGRELRQLRGRLGSGWIRVRACRTVLSMRPRARRLPRAAPAARGRRLWLRPDLGQARALSASQPGRHARGRLHSCTRRPVGGRAWRGGVRRADPGGVWGGRGRRGARRPGEAVAHGRDVAGRVHPELEPQAAAALEAAQAARAVRRPDELAGPARGVAPSRLVPRSACGSALWERRALLTAGMCVLLIDCRHHRGVHQRPASSRFPEHLAFEMNHPGAHTIDFPRDLLSSPPHFNALLKTAHAEL